MEALPLNAVGRLGDQSFGSGTSVVRIQIESLEADQQVVPAQPIALLALARIYKHPG